MLAGWLLQQAGIASPDGAMTVAPASPRDRIAFNADGTLSGRVRNVPFAGEAHHIAVVASSPKGSHIALVAASACRIEHSETIGHDSTGHVAFANSKIERAKLAPQGLTQTSLMMMGATARSLQIAGALESMLDISVTYANERVAFEKKIGKFQAIQHNLARLAGEAAAAMTAAGSAADALAANASPEAIMLEVASAKIRCAEAAEAGAAIAHQVHGAIGFSMEHVLHRYTMRALA
jgi:acyl-CoA dehydrogenase